MTKIEWTEKTWNPIVGCSIVSPGCANCYAMKMARRLELMSATQFPQYAGTTQIVNGNAVWTGKVALASHHILTALLRRKNPTRYFVSSMGDLFHESVPDEWITQVFVVMMVANQHTYQVLTKRSARMREWMSAPNRAGEMAAAIRATGIRHGWGGPIFEDATGVKVTWQWPPPNVWLGVSAERQTEADARVPDLLATPAAVRFVSAEPLLSEIVFQVPHKSLPSGIRINVNALTGETGDGKKTGRLDWVIVGGESGDSNARPMHPDWARSIRNQCTAAGVPFFFKQWGHWALFADGDGDPIQAFAHRNDWMLVERDGGLDIPDYRWPSKDEGQCAMLPVGKSRSGRLLDGRTWDEMPLTDAQRVDE